MAVLVAVLLGASVAFAETVQLDSPDGHLKLTIEVAADGGVTHAVIFSTSAAINSRSAPATKAWPSAYVFTG